MQRIADKDRLTGAIDGGGRPGIDHPFVVDGSENFSVVMRDVGELASDCHRMIIQSTHPSFVVYTSNWIPPAEDSRHTVHAAICLETCGYADAVNNRKLPAWPPKSACLLYKSHEQFETHDAIEPQREVSATDHTCYEHVTIHKFRRV